MARSVAADWTRPYDSRPIAGEGGTVTDGNISRATPLQQGKWLTVCEVCALAGFVFGGSAAGRLFEIRFPPNHIRHLESLGIRPGELALIEGHLVSVPRRSSSGLQFELEIVNIAPAPLSVAGQIGGPAVRSHSVSGRIRLWLNAGNDFAALNSLRLRYGDSIRVPVSLRRPRVSQPWDL